MANLGLVALAQQAPMETSFDPIGRKTYLDYQPTEFTISERWMNTFCKLVEGILVYQPIYLGIFSE